MQGTEQLGKYRILEELGRGGFATVYRALDSTLDREIALKVLDPLFLRDATWVARFRREAKAAARLVHPHIVTIYEIDEADGRLYIAMQLARGGSLADRIAAQGRLGWEETLALLQPVCEALTYAHAEGLVHRDLKPGNVLLDPGLGPLVVDFGFARLLGDNSLTLSVSGGIVGTPSYIAPEVWELDSAKAPADIYALGCIVYEMLTGEVLFGGRTPIQVMRAHDRGPSLPAAWPDGVPEGLADLLAVMLAKAPADRYESPRALWEALATMASRGQLEAEEQELQQRAAAEAARRQRVSEAKEHQRQASARAAHPQREAAEQERVFSEAEVAALIQHAFRERELERRNGEALRAHQATLTLAPGVEMAFVAVPAGPFLMGSDPGKDKEAHEVEQPQREVTLDGYWMGKAPVTNAQYAAFVAATGHRAPSHWKDGRIPEGKADHPVVYVDWEDAAAFCAWVSGLGQGEVRLPSEAEWEKAARGRDGRIYPWGDQAPTKERCNFDDNVRDTTAVGRYSPQGDSPYGCVDMAGNVYEWCADWWEEAYYRHASDRNPTGPESGKYRVVRGGCWGNDDNGYLRSACRGTFNLSQAWLGFRCVRSQSS